MMAVQSLQREPPERIAVFRALQLGDLLCAVPALRALRAAWPRARITLVGLAGAAGFVQRYASLVDELLWFPGIAQFPEQPPHPDKLPGFFEDAQQRRFDLAIQMHGTGTLVNDLVRRMRPKRWAGFVPEPALARPGWRYPWPADLPESMRYTALLRYMGLPVASEALWFPLQRADHVEVVALGEKCRFAPADTVLLHPGARLPSRRWPSQRFAAVGRALQAAGWRVAVTGSPDERALTQAVLQELGAGATDLTGLTSLGGLAALLSRTPLLICNDTGISHVAAAVGARSVVVASGSDVRRWAPLDAARHRVLAHQTPCRPCAHACCPYPDHPCATGVSVQEVLVQAAKQLQEGRPAHG
jgi:ADP-heptose:LPS heptosyltransferase